MSFWDSSKPIMPSTRTPIDYCRFHQSLEECTYSESLCEGTFHRAKEAIGRMERRQPRPYIMSPSQKCNACGKPVLSSPGALPLADMVMVHQECW